MSLLLEALQRSQNRPLALEAVDPRAAPSEQAQATEPTSPSTPDGLELTLAPAPEPAVAQAPATPAIPPPGPEAPPQQSATPAAPAPQVATPARAAASPASMAGATSPAAATPARAAGAAREAAQAMVGAAAPSQNNGARGRRMAWGPIAGLTLAVLSWMGWQYWVSQQRPGLMPAGMAPGTAPEPAAAQGEVAPPPDGASQPLDAAASADGSNAPAASAPGVEAVAAAPLPAPTPLAAPAVLASPARQDLVPPADRSAATPPPPAARTPPAQDVSSPQPAEALTPEPRRRAAMKAATEAAIPAASAAAAQLVRSQAQAQLQAGWAALREGDAAKAQALYQQVLAERPEDPDATLGLAVSLHRQRQHEAAWAAYQRSLQIWPDNDTARTGMLAILSDSDPATAESRLQEWVQSRPRDAAAQAALGNLLGRQGRWPEALGPLTLAQSLAPGHAAYAYNLAVALDQARRYEEAVRMYRQALQQAVSGASGVPLRAVERRIDELQELWAQ